MNTTMRSIVPAGMTMRMRNIAAAAMNTIMRNTAPAGMTMRMRSIAAAAAAMIIAVR